MGCMVATESKRIGGTTGWSQSHWSQGIRFQMRQSGRVKPLVMMIFYFKVVPVVSSKSSKEPEFLSASFLKNGFILLV